LKRKPFFINFVKRGNKRKFSHFSQNFVSRKIFILGMVFAKILGNNHQCSDLDTHSSGSWIRIRIPNGKFSRKLSQNRKFLPNLSGKFSQLFVSFFLEKRKNFLRENTKTKIFVSTLVPGPFLNVPKFKRFLCIVPSVIKNCLASFFLFMKGCKGNSLIA
jgi:hypothetical protein